MRPSRTLGQAGLRRDRRGATALEFALVCPAFIMFIFGFIVVADLIQCRRAMDFGVERALRYAAVHSTAGATGVQNAYYKAAFEIMSDVGTSSASSTVQATASPSFGVGNVVTVTATYTWNPLVNYSFAATPMFGTMTMTATGSITAVN